MKPGGRIMWNKSKMLRSIGITLTLLFSLAFLTLPTEVEGGAKVVPIEGMSYNVNSSIESNLKSLVGKKVYVTLDSGKTLAGFLKEVGNHLIHVEKLDGKDFFDALIRIENVIAIEAKFRDFQR
jgi:small nuclear ribonucleoprotein (snRNP)-like protein